MPRLSKIGAAALAAFGWTGLSSVTASYLVVAGGGGGGGANDTPAGGGGGAGGYLAGTTALNPTQSYTVTVGAAGAGGSSVTVGNNGSNSVFNTITSIGGGGGGTYAYGSGVAGGSGGGAAWPTGYSGGSGTVGQGNAGGKNTTSGTFQGGGGGGGAGAVGTTVTGNDGGAGGAGTASSITGSSVTYAGGGGGGGGAGNNPTYGTGGSATGGGGSGGTASATGANGSTGTANLGGGGGGAGGSGPSPYTARSGGNGGSGVVIISYPSPQKFGGGIVTSSGGNTIHTFQTSGTLSPLSSLTASALIVAGGGGGGARGAGGGGAGGLLSGSGITIDTNSIYVVTVGAGGAGGVTSAKGTIGLNSVFSAYATAAVGGGGGGTYDSAPTAGGGSGGGGGDNEFNSSGTGATGTSGQGNAGGTGGNSGATYVGGGGGGAGAVGGNANVGSNLGGNGGAGSASSISGTSVTYAGGGGGSSFSGTGGSGGSGGGGSAFSGNTNGDSGTANLGGGGGAGGYPTSTGGSGGSGIVIISYAGATQLMAGGTVTISGGNVIHTFTSSGYLSPIKLVGNSLRFRSSASAYLSRTFSNSSTNNKILTYSAWVKRGILSTEDVLVDAYDGSSAAEFQLYFDTSNSLSFTFGGASAFQLTTTAVYRDPAAWYHVVLAIDTTQATASNRVKFYVNGTQITAFSTANYPSQNATSQFPALSGNNKIGSNWNSGSGFLDGYLTEVNFIDGQALTPNSFGTFNSYGVWQPITYGGSYGTNGFYLPFTNTTSTTTLGFDFSPQGNNWTTNNISLTAGSTYDSMTDVPTLTSTTVANYATLNPLWTSGTATSPTLTGGNLNVASNGGATFRRWAGTIGIDSGKYYFEVTRTDAVGAGNYFAFGITNANSALSTDSYGGNPTSSGATSVEWALTDRGTACNTSTYTDLSGTIGTIGQNDVVQICIDMDSKKIWFGKNNTFSGSPSAGTGQAFSNLSSLIAPIAYVNGATTSVTASINFGQRPFAYTAPSGFLPLNTFNL
jgi:hypothetical protein